MVSAVVVTPLVTRTLGGAEYGVVALGVAAYQVLGVVLALGLPAAITRNALIEAAGTRGAAGTVVLGSGAVAVLSAFGVLGVSVLPIRVGGLPADVLRLALLSGAGLAVVTLCQAQLRAERRVGTFVALGIGTAVLPPVAGLVTASATLAHADRYLGAVSVGQLAVAVVALAVVVASARPAPTRRGWEHALRIALPTVPHQLATGGVVGCLVLLVGNAAGPVVAGQSQLALLVGTVPVLLVGAFNNAWAPHVYAVPPADQAAFVARTARPVLRVAACLAVGLAAVAPWVLHLLAPPELARPSGWAAAGLAALAAPVSVLYLSNVHLVFASGRTGLLAVTSPVSLLLALGAFVAASRAGVVAPVAAACALVAFHVLQSVAAEVLRRRTGRPSVGTAHRLPVVGGTVAAVVALVAWDPPHEVRVVVAVLVALAGAVALRGLETAARPRRAVPERTVGR
ncbi:hypothetical protein GC089_14985 [Cellulomonas sp. JZ18]|uniref:lipopolysaccharide biosynthesis protein n=1 Tax=Cellulomonas sp. JZ18 TaxID=2654191 RepID=UPI0012D43EB6|nr:lipopolysaccharide biosynthesis protein [Cellulomonas sp. JZ18]QGQ20263.1 hypothetical protein GC089_14985 [Cellulomonas sp. JZ18]